MSTNTCYPPHLKKLISNSVNALVFNGNCSSYLKQIALCFAKDLLQTTKQSPADLTLAFPEEKSDLYSFKRIQKYIEDMQFEAHESLKKVYIFHYAEKLPILCENALLKTFEDLPKNVHIILLTTKKEMILKTILSRCIVLDICDDSKKGSECELKSKVFELMMKICTHKDPKICKSIEDASSHQVLVHILNFFRDLYIHKNKINTQHLSYPDKSDKIVAIKVTNINLEQVLGKIDILYHSSQSNINYLNYIPNIFL